MPTEHVTPIFKRYTHQVPRCIYARIYTKYLASAIWRGTFRVDSHRVAEAQLPVQCRGTFAHESESALEICMVLHFFNPADLGRRGRLHRPTDQTFPVGI